VICPALSDGSTAVSSFSLVGFTFSVVVDKNTAFQKVGKKEKWRLAPWSANDVIAATAVVYCCGSHTHVDRESRYKRHDRRKPDLDNKQ